MAIFRISSAMAGGKEIKIWFLAMKDQVEKELFFRKKFAED